jgi:hypothetical protein
MKRKGKMIKKIKKEKDKNRKEIKKENPTFIRKRN